MSDLPATIWDDLKIHQDFFTTKHELYQSIVSTLLHECFTDEATPVAAMLLQAMPLLDNQLSSSTPTSRKLKISIDVARFVGFHDIAIMKREDEQRLIFEVALLILLSLRNDFVTCPYPSVAQLIAHYPEFENQDEAELGKLMHFANFMTYAQILLPPKQRKAHLLDIVTRAVEGSSKKYVCGGGQTAATARRVLIYERVGGTTNCIIIFRERELCSLAYLKNIVYHRHIEEPTASPPNGRQQSGLGRYHGYH
jgi:hypothetical protein